MTNVNEKLDLLQNQIFRQKQLQSQLATLKAQKDILAQKVKTLATKKHAEQLDVERLESHSLASFFYAVMGKRDEKLNKEQEEAYAAAVKYDVAAKELSAIEDGISRIHSELQTLFGCERRYEVAWTEKAETLKSLGGETADAILKLEEQNAYLNNQIREINEAISAGNLALNNADLILSRLGSAENWGTWDLVGGGLLSGAAKHSHLDEAQRLVERLQVQLRTFQTELSDITIHSDVQVQIDGFLRFADFFFDGLFADWAVLKRIGNSKEQIQNTRNQIKHVLNQITTMKITAQNEQTHIKNKLNQLILESHSSH